MAINERLVHTASAAAAGGVGTGNQEEGLILHLDANDVDSYDGDGDIWYDIHDHEYTPATNVSEHFNTVTYAGNGGNDNPITSVGFQPDLVLIKGENNTVHHVWMDSVRGPSSIIGSSFASAASSQGASWRASFGELDSFDSDGFTVSDGTNSTSNFNSAHNYVAWCFKAGGLINKSAYFNGNGYITTGYTAGTGTSASISSWINIEAYTAYGAFVGDSTGSGAAARFFIGQGAGTSGNLWVSVGNGTSSWYDATSVSLTSYGLNKWFHLAGTVDGTTVKIYINGSLVYTYTSSISYVGAGTSPYYLGGWGSSLYLQGKLNQVRFFNNALTSSEVTQLYNETKEDNSVLNFPSGAGCVAAYPLGENANGVDGLYNGTASSVTFGNPGYLTRNTEGTIESTVTANNDLGFSIAKYTATGVTATVGHGLDTPPEMIIAKTINQAYNWIVYHKDLGASNYLVLNSSDASASSSAFMNNTSPTSSVFTAGAGQNLNYANNDQIITYNFTSKRGVSKVGNFIGTGASGNKIYTGFEPAFVMWKNADNSASNSMWFMFDNQRGDSAYLMANSSSSEGTDASVEFHRDGFIVPNVGAINNSGQTHIYYAVAKSTNVADLTPSTDGEEIEVDLGFDPSKVHYSDTNYAFEQDNTVWRGNADNTSGSHEGEVYINNYFESGDTGKYYFEIESLGHTHGSIGFTDPTKYTAGQGLTGGLSKTSWRNNYFYGVSNAYLMTYNGSATYSSLSTGINTLGTVLAVAIDVATRKVWMGTVSSGTVTWFSSGNPSTGANPLMTIPTTWSFYQPLVADGSYSGGSARTGWHKLLRTLEATTLPTGFVAMTGAIKNADLELHLDAANFDGSTNTPTTWTALTGSNGTITGATYDGELGNFLNISSDSTYIDVATANMLDSDFTIEMWYNLNSTSSSYKMLLGGSNYAGGSGLGHYIYGDTIKTWVSVSGTATNVLTSPGVLTANKWHHIVLKREGSNWKQYVDGEEVGTATGITSGLSSANSRIGRHYNSTGLSAPGKIGQVRIYSTALSETQIRQNFNFTKNDYPNGFNAVTATSYAPSFSTNHFDFDTTSSTAGDRFQINPSPIPSTSSTVNESVRSISLWARRNSTAASTFGTLYHSSGKIELNYNVTDDRMEVWKWINGKATHLSGSNNLSRGNGSTSINTDWHHYVFIMTGTGNDDYKLYIDKVEETLTKSITTTQGYTYSGSYVGSRPAYSGTHYQHFDGDISDIKVFNKVLTQEEVNTQFAIGYNGIG